MNNDNNQINIGEVNNVVEDNKDKTDEKNTKFLSKFLLCNIVASVLASGPIFLLMSMWETAHAGSGGFAVFILFLFLLPVGIIAGAACLIAWIVFFVILIYYKFFLHLNTNVQTSVKRVAIVIWIILSFVIVGIPCAVVGYNYVTNVYANRLDMAPGSLNYSSNTYYVVYKDKIYYYKKIGNINCLYSMNLDGSGNKYITSDKQLDSISFFMTYKGEAYFNNDLSNNSDLKKSGNKKINLETGKITLLNNDYSYIDYTLDNGIVYAYKLNGDMKTVYKINLNNNDILYESKPFNPNISYFDYAEGSYYTIKNSNNLVLCKDNQIIFDQSVNLVINQNRKMKNQILFKKDNYLYFIYNSNIFKYNLQNNMIEGMNDLSLKSHSYSVYSVVDTNDKDSCYVFDTRNLFILDIDSLELKKCVTHTFDYTSSIDNEVYVTKDNYIVSRNTNLVFERESSNIGIISFYNKDSSLKDKVLSVTRASFDYENKVLYLVTKDKEKHYNIEKYSLD